MNPAQSSSDSSSTSSEEDNDFSRQFFSVEEESETEEENDEQMEDAENDGAAGGGAEPMEDDMSELSDIDNLIPSMKIGNTSTAAANDFDYSPQNNGKIAFSGCFTTFVQPPLAFSGVWEPKGENGKSFLSAAKSAYVQTKLSEQKGSTNAMLPFVHVLNTYAKALIEAAELAAIFGVVDTKNAMAVDEGTKPALLMNSQFERQFNVNLSDQLTPKTPTIVFASIMESGIPHHPMLWQNPQFTPEGSTTPEHGKSTNAFNILLFIDKSTKNWGSNMQHVEIPNFSISNSTPQRMIRVAIAVPVEWAPNEIWTAIHATAAFSNFKTIGGQQGVNTYTLQQEKFSAAVNTPNTHGWIEFSAVPFSPTPKIESIDLKITVNARNIQQTDRSKDIELERTLSLTFRDFTDASDGFSFPGNPGMAVTAAGAACEYAQEVPHLFSIKQFSAMWCAADHPLGDQDYVMQILKEITRQHSPADEVDEVIKNIMCVNLHRVSPIIRAFPFRMHSCVHAGTVTDEIPTGDWKTVRAIIECHLAIQSAEQNGTWIDSVTAQSWKNLNIHVNSTSANNPSRMLVEGFSGMFGDRGVFFAEQYWDQLQSSQRVAEQMTFMDKATSLAKDQDARDRLNMLENSMLWLSDSYRVKHVGNFIESAAAPEPTPRSAIVITFEWLMHAGAVSNARDMASMFAGVASGKKSTRELLREMRSIGVPREIITFASLGLAPSVDFEFDSTTVTVTGALDSFRAPREDMHYTAAMAAVIWLFANIPNPVKILTDPVWNQELEVLREKAAIVGGFLCHQDGQTRDQRKEQVKLIGEDVDAALEFVSAWLGGFLKDQTVKPIFTDPPIVVYPRYVASVDSKGTGSRHLSAAGLADSGNAEDVVFVVLDKIRLGVWIAIFMEVLSKIRPDILKSTPASTMPFIESIAPGRLREDKHRALTQLAEEVLRLKEFKKVNGAGERYTARLIATV